MLQLEQPEDLVICTGESHSVRELLAVAFARLDLDWQRYVEIDPRYFRPSEVDDLHGDMTRARRVLQWEPKVRFRALIEMMVDHDLADLLRHRH
jgi:GDPmannose 4,6-dehydratase